MSKLMETEFEASKKYELKTEKDDKKQVEISPENVALVEALIRYSSYGSAVQDKNLKSAKYWINLLNGFYKPADSGYEELKKTIRKSLQDQNVILDTSEQIFRFLIAKIVSYIDRENSTHLQADGCGRNEMIQRIVDNEANLREWLRTSDYKLIKILSEQTHPKDEEKYRPRCNFSFATKFCHYMCFYLFKDSEEQDNFSIYDGVVAKNLYRYTGKDESPQEYIFDSNKAKKENDYSVKFYDKYQKAIDGIREGKISRNGFDHLLWYFHKSKDQKLGDSK